MKVYTVSVPKSAIEGFKLFAVDRHPKEAYAVLFGHINGSRATVRDLWYPEDQRRFATSRDTETVLGRMAWLRKAIDIAESSGVSVIGDMHSHPVENKECLNDPAPSYTDWAVAWGQLWITGICVVVKTPRRTATRVKFWPPIQRPRLHLTTL